MNDTEVDNGDIDGGDSTEGITDGKDDELHETKGGEQSDNWGFPSSVEWAEFQKLSSYEQERGMNIHHNKQLL